MPIPVAIGSGSPKETKQATIADRCIPKRASEVASELSAS
jgi:hypothetical protein